MIKFIQVIFYCAKKKEKAFFYISLAVYMQKSIEANPTGKWSFKNAKRRARLNDDGDGDRRSLCSCLAHA